MGNSGGYLVFGVLMLILVPIVMSYIGSTFGETISAKSDFSGETDSFLVSLGNFFLELGSVPIIGSVFTFLGNMFIGYDIFPWWINVILITIPVLLIIRGTVSTSA